MTEPSTNRLPWPRFVVEGGVIVVSVLLALAGDAWWEGRQQRQEEAAVLSSLRADFQATLGLIAESRSGFRTSATAAERLIALTGPGTPAVSAAAVDTLLAQAITGTAFNPVEATLIALVSSGSLRIISNADLRGALAEWSPRLARIRRIEAQNTGQILNHFMPYLYDRIPVRSLDAINRPLTGSQASGFTHDSRTLLRELRFENGLNDVVFYHRLLDSNLGDLGVYVQATLNLLDAEMRIP